MSFASAWIDAAAHIISTMLEAGVMFKEIKNVG